MNASAASNMLFNRNHSFPQNAEFFSRARAVEFARFRGISAFSRNFMEFCNGRWKRENTAYFGWV